MGGFGRKALGSVSVAVLRRERLSVEARSDRSGAALRQPGVRDAFSGTALGLVAAFLAASVSLESCLSSYLYM